MSAKGLKLAQEKMRQAGMGPAAIDAFTYYYGQLEGGATGLIPESDIEPLRDLPRLADIDVSAKEAADALDKTVMIRLNGGLGTSMGLDRAKTMLPVRGGQTFMEIIIAQVLHARAATGARLPLILMNSFRTREDAEEVFAQHPDLRVGDLPLDFIQNKEPKIDAETLEPVTWPADLDLEWCPPGHGDIYTKLYETGLIDQLLNDGYRYLFCANGDNLGATADGRIAAWFAQSGAPYAAEVTPRTPADVKGGHIVRRRLDGQLILRETAQTAPEEMRFFTNGDLHPYAHTNNLWLNLEALRDVLNERKGVMQLPLIRNEKTVDPRDPASPHVFQLETAMGAAVGSFEGATALVVGRDRFLPVKTTNDLMVISSDAYDMAADAIPRLRGFDEGATAPLVDLDPRFFKTITDFQARFPAGVPSLRSATSFTVRGDWTFEAGVKVSGEVTLEDKGSPATVSAGSALR
ncbi:MAG: UTP--glucose-1-phosphate uridylyltransferase [Actinomycetaceae bacterium]|nr:UTP--glucose-1-phosphate uridylyltransferase [Actinomycetaceae bacterium]